MHYDSPHLGCCTGCLESAVFITAKHVLFVAKPSSVFVCRSRPAEYLASSPCRSNGFSSVKRTVKKFLSSPFASGRSNAMAFHSTEWPLGSCVRPETKPPRRMMDSTLETRSSVILLKCRKNKQTNKQTLMFLLHH